MVAGIVGACSTALLGLSAWLEPSPTGLGTHEQLHLPPCGWIATIDMPCPTCGMTTAFAYAAHGDLLHSFLAQPLGCVLVVSVAMTLLVCVHVIVTGSRLARVFARLWGVRTAWALGFAVLSAWGYKIASYKGWL